MKKFEIVLENLYEALDGDYDSDQVTEHGIIKFHGDNYGETYDFFAKDNYTDNPNCENNELCEIIKVTDDTVTLKSEFSDKPFVLTKEELYYSVRDYEIKNLKDVIGKSVIDKIERELYE